jgi:hypothetical protein
MDSPLLLPLGLFAVAATAGLIMAARLFAQKAPPIILPVLHGLFAVSGVVTLFLAIQAGGLSQYALYALALFLAAALGGLFLISFQLRGKFPPRAIILVHALVAVSAFALLFASAFQLI